MKNDNTSAVMAELPHSSAIEALCEFRDNHSFWDNQLFEACRKGLLNRSDFQYIFAQYFHYARNFTRYLTAVMANCTNDLHRAQLAENLWEEAGEEDPEKRHAELFRAFLRKELAIESFNEIDFEPFTVAFVDQFLKLCKEGNEIYGTAFLSLGTEGMVGSMYTTLVEGMEKAGIEASGLHFFHLHIECDDEHALVLENMLRSFENAPNWYETSKKAIDDALTLRRDFFNQLMMGLNLQKLAPIHNAIKKEKSLANQQQAIHVAGNSNSGSLYQNQDDQKNISFEVQRLLLDSTVLDPRIVSIPQNKNNELHKHAHETLIYMLQGSGVVKVDGQSYPVAAGDALLVPRWAVHQTINTGDEELRFLGVTDFKLTKNFLGNTETSYRENTDGVNAELAIGAPSELNVAQEV